MKVIWNLEKTVAIPISNIKDLEINNIDEWGKSSKEQWDGGRYYVIARYTVCTGHAERVFTSDSREECEKFIENL